MNSHSGQQLAPSGLPGPSKENEQLVGEHEEGTAATADVGAQRLQYAPNGSAETAADKTVEKQAPLENSDGTGAHQYTTTKVNDGQNTNIEVEAREK